MGQRPELRLREHRRFILIIVLSLAIVPYQNCSEPIRVLDSKSSSGGNRSDEPVLEEELPSVCLQNYRAPSLQGVPGQQTILFGMGSLSGTVNPGRQPYNYTEGSVPIEFNCSSSNDRVDVNCNMQGVRVTADTDFECQTGFATITVAVGDQCLSEDEEHSMTFQVQMNDNCRPEATIKASQPQRVSLFGTKVAIDGDYAVVSAPAFNNGNKQLMGSGYIFSKNGNQWQEQAQLLPNAPAEAEITGVALRGSLAVLGAPSVVNEQMEYTGAIYIYQRSGSDWNLVQTIVGPATSSALSRGFGHDISLGNDQRIYVSAYGDDSQQGDSGAVHVYTYISGSGQWEEQTVLKSPTPRLYEHFGYSVAVEESVLVVGAPVRADRDSSVGPGRVYIYRNNAGSWVHEDTVSGDNAYSIQQFGHDVDTDGVRVIVGAYLAAVDGRKDSGAAYVLTESGGQWSDTMLAPIRGNNNDRDSEDLFGYSVAIEGDRAVVGAPGDASKRGAVYHFNRSGNDWNLEYKVRVRATTRQANNEAGTSVDLSGNRLIVGVPGDNTDGSGGALDNSGAAKVIDLN